MIKGSSSAIPTSHEVTTHILSPSFTADLFVQADNADDLCDVHTFEELAAAMRAAPVLDGAPKFMEVKDRDPLTEAIGDDRLDSKPPIVGDNTDNEEGTTRIRRSQAQSSSQTQQYPLHFSNLDLEEMNQSAFSDQQLLTIHGDVPSMLGINEFRISQQFQSKEKVGLTIKSYNIRWGVEYKFGSKYNWLIHVTMWQRKSYWEVRKYNGEHTYFAT
ncbi:hypothetical protein Ahy_A03g012247 [Arachis hypogaea]|uniref:Transposase MuDR plant domain-containing protein n=1 Tax=Arachis hypogaea TaxID=3818 RepID=A0A445DSV6_ARAHY|nr:hypothetical protein Ahy_A03g012247 [Arachis hypogaea]